ncbi:hypothetical protein [Actinopolymorpha pittospori]|uniref:Uncharacterized protein n=1 Tax=Actinopolymorpha pittospori TaxID=648752 RepID=A0A927N1H7_9ACTN|nr:hypothetical protein [Actinopolymorpha pittospori]MBE1610925.1 hypothetical protein [Actinopolymorpha pittospori]
MRVAGVACAESTRMSGDQVSSAGVAGGMPGTSFPGVEGVEGVEGEGVGDGAPEGGAGEAVVGAAGSPEEVPVVVDPHDAVRAVSAVTVTRAAA